MLRIAITRQVSPRIGECLLTHLDREPINVQRAQAQHEQYEDCLSKLGYQVQRLPAEPDLPDSVFVEDTAIVFDELAIVSQPGNPARRPETVSVAAALAAYRDLTLYPASRHAGRRRCAGRGQAGVCRSLDADQPGRP